MKRQKLNSAGFTLMELMISMAVGLIVLGAIASIFNGALTATKVVTQRAQVQQDMRSAVDLIVKDITMAGAGLTSGIQLPSGTGATVSKYGCDQTGTCHVPNGTYPTVGGVSNYLYGVVPGYLNGVEAGATIPAAPAPAVMTPSPWPTPTSTSHCPDTASLSAAQTMIKSPLRRQPARLRS